MTDLAALRQANEQRWANMVVTPSLVDDVDAVAKRLLLPQNQTHFKALSVRTGVPVNVIAVIKEREAGNDPLFQRNIAQGDPWNKASTHVPAGRGPFNSWEDAGYDALVNCAPYAARNKDWSMGGTLTILEQYNGLGYANKGRPSPYIWASTNQYVSGKYVADGVYDPNVVDKQIGCAAILKRMNELAGIQPIPAPQPTPTPQPIPAPMPTPEQAPPMTGWIASLIKFIQSLFGRK